MLIYFNSKINEVTYLFANIFVVFYKLNNLQDPFMVS